MKWQRQQQENSSSTMTAAVSSTNMGGKEGGSSTRLRIVCMKVSFFMSRDLKPQIGTFFGRRRGRKKRLRKKRKGLTITVYPHNKRLLNITGIKDLDHYNQARRFAQKYYSIMNNSVVIRERIDNIMFTRKMFNNYDMSSMVNVCVKLFSHTHHVQYDDERTTSKGIFLKPKIKPNCGSFNLYRTGSVTIMGAKQMSDIYQCQLMLDKIYQNCKVVGEVT